MEADENRYGFSKHEWEACLKVLNKLKNNPFNNPDNEQFSGLIKKVIKTAKKQQYSQKKSAAVNTTKNAILANNALKQTSFYGEELKNEKFTFTKVEVERHCYACNNNYNQIHSFYHRLCPKCVAINLKERWRNMDLKGRHVILTGGRVKVGFATALKLLRAGAHLTITTRFPAQAAQQFKQETDSNKWWNRLEFYGLDLRLLDEVNRFINYYSKKYNQLDILINNAAQTIKYPAEYYSPLIRQEQELLQTQPQLLTNVQANKQLNSQPSKGLLTLDKHVMDLNRFGQPVDNRQKNSWNATLEEIEPLELVEANLINQISPYLLIKGLTPLMNKSSFRERFIINVTSSEGQFSYSNKTIFHPHTNMTKAALNMLTRTSAKEYADYSIYMSAVDVGWISTGAKEDLRKAQFEQGYIPPLDSVDGAARIMYPVFEKLENGNTFTGVLLKNYKVEVW
jgi:NAD(P)-dependent dehydrogenase (short-subunit alcohol dehydrogenase family)